MADLKLQPTYDAGDVTILPNGGPEMTDGLNTAVYISLFTPAWWGNSISEAEERYGSKIPEIMKTGLLTNQTRLNVIEAARASLQWMLDEGIADQIDVTAEIPTVGTLYLAVKIFEAENSDVYGYALNWAAEEIELMEDNI